MESKQKCRSIILIAFSFLISSSLLAANYCIQKNFDTGVEVHNQSAKMYQKAIEILNPYIETYNKQEFVHKKYTERQLIEVMAHGDASLLESLNLQIASIEAIYAEMMANKNIFVNAKKRAPTAIKLWERVADSCEYEEEDYNLSLAKKQKKASEALLKKIEDNDKKFLIIQETYVKEIEFLKKLRKTFKLILGCE